MKVKVQRIDKLYVARFGYNNEGIAVFDESEVGIKNQLLDAYLKVLLTKDNTSSLKLSIDNATDNVKEVLKDIESNIIVRPAPFEVYTPSYQEDRKAEYTGGKAGIGPFALNNAHHILTLLTGLKMAENDFTKALGIVDLGRIYDQPTAGNPKGGRILDWLSAMINAFVDIAKDPYITRLNVNAYTYNMVSFLLRTGKGKWTFYFMSQPILKEIAQEVLKTKGKYGVDNTKTASQLEQEAIDRVLQKYDENGEYRKQFDTVNKDDILSANEYAELFNPRLLESGQETTITRDLLKNSSVADFNRQQVRMWYAFKKLKPYADSLSNLVKYSKIDTKKTGKSFAERTAYYRAMQALKEDPNFAPGEIERFYENTFIQHKTDNDIIFGNSIFRNLLMRSTELFEFQLYQILSLLGRSSNANSSLLSPIINAMESLIKANFFNEYAQKNNIDIKSMFTGRMSMAKRLNNFKLMILRRDPKLSHLIDNTGTITNDFLEFLIPNIENTPDNPDGLDFIDTADLLNTDTVTADNMINYWRELIEDPNPQISKLFKDLALYAFITSGDNAAMNAFFQYLPNSFRKDIGYIDYINQQLDQLVNNSTLDYMNKDDLFLNNWLNDKLVKPISLIDFNNNPMLAIYENNIPVIIMGARTGKGGFKSAIHPINWAVNTVDGKTYPIFPPYIKYKDGNGNTPQNWHVYTLIGYTVESNNRYFPVYGLVSKKGYKYKGHTITEYGVNTQFDFNKEIEYDYTEVVNNPELLVSKDSMFGEQWAKIMPINELFSYSDYNYVYSNKGIVVEEDVESDNISLQETPDSMDNTGEPNINNSADFTLHSESNPQNIQSVNSLLTTNQEGLKAMDLWDYGTKKVKEVLEPIREDLTKEQYDTYLNEFSGMLKEEYDNGNLNTREEVEGVVNKFMCNL